ncbi:DUF6515 family protein [Schlegelella sp. S2-27]|uniref:DUF6515 family protein n=1 Tax=Caldimonas mangrovi TaxID=2944811 RepID=A0ABT0YXF4_9BURK|nr:DUF6515 family protein [Caldimonas mangrovi]MCM5682861.1 DUF6515 family protein [Caldimonas mangrovi]
MDSMPFIPWLQIVAMATVLACPVVSQAEPADRDRGARQKEQRAEPRGAQLRDHDRERGPRPAPPRLRSPSERPAPDVHRPPHVRSGDRERRPHWDDDRRRRHDRPPPHWHDDRRWDRPPHHHSHYRHAPRYRWGHHVSSLGPRAHLSLHFGERYWFDDGFWYTPAPSGFVVVRPPVGVYLNALPVGYTLVRVGPSVYYHANGVYYTEAPSGGYQVAQVQDDDPAPSYQPPMVYPARGQSAEQQRSDEYECHTWAVDRAGFDPTLVPLGQGPEGDSVLRGNYQRALTACLEGRGYTVK